MKKLLRQALAFFRRLFARLWAKTQPEITDWPAFVKSFNFDRQPSHMKRQLFTLIMSQRPKPKQ